MPRRQKAKKDVASCDKFREAAASVEPEISEWGNPAAKAVSPKGRRTEGTEPSKYLQEEKSKEIPQVVASERGRAQTVYRDIYGVVGRHIVDVDSERKLINGKQHHRG